ncbi:hypothetical protein FB451DRAFT_1270524 [Mycena latifolia]|nr:hypothetical protein FB451DRAFT_1270524 [Mycena latifolia]
MRDRKVRDIYQCILLPRITINCRSPLTSHRTFDDGHPFAGFAGFYLDYLAGESPMGLVRTISKDPQ